MLVVGSIPQDEAHMQDLRDIIQGPVAATAAVAVTATITKRATDQCSKRPAPYMGRRMTT